MIEEKKHFEKRPEIITASAGFNGLIMRGGYSPELGTLPLISGTLEQVNTFLDTHAERYDMDGKVVYLVADLDKLPAGHTPKDVYWHIQKWLYLAKKKSQSKTLVFHINECGNKKLRREMAQRLNNLLH